MVGSKLSSKIQLKIYEMNKMGLKAHVIANHLNLDVLLVKQCIKHMGIPTTKDCMDIDNPERIYEYLSSTALNMSKEEAERRTVIKFKIGYSTFNAYYRRWRNSYLQDYSECHVSSHGEDVYEDDFEEDDL